MKLLNKSKYKGLPLATLFLLCISLAWQSPAMAKKNKPAPEDPFFPASGPVFVDDGDDTVFTEGEGLFLVGTEKIKLSQCDKPPKSEISVHLAFPAAGEVHIVAIDGVLLGTTIVTVVDNPLTPIDEMETAFQPDPIIGTYTRKNKVWFHLDFGNGKGNGNGNGNGGNNREDGSGFDLIMSRFEGILEPFCGEEVTLGTKKTKFRFKVKGNAEDGFKTALYLDAKLRRNGTPKDGSGVAKIKVKGKPGSIFEVAVAPAPETE